MASSQIGGLKIIGDNLKMAKKYRLVGKNRTITEVILISEAAKEDYKELMNWTEDDFQNSTVLIEE